MDLSLFDSLVCCLLDVLRSIEIGTSDLKMKDFFPLSFHCQGFFVDLTDAGRDHPVHSGCYFAAHNISSISNALMRLLLGPVCCDIILTVLGPGLKISINITCY